MKHIRLTDDKKNIYTIYDDRGIATGTIAPKIFPAQEWIAVENGKTVASGEFVEVLKTLFPNG